ncbi:MAG: cysteine desulfurase NifS [Desulfotomaculaceae bacterium]|nr:cysteine desulfurase NifS [Desulfotomaculaceae bacterium]
MRRIYLDHSGTTPVDRRVADEMYRFLIGDNFGNPSSHHYFGYSVKQAVEEAREKVAHALGASREEVVFTSGGTEADNLAIHGAVTTNLKKGNHVITSAIEHHAVLNTVKALGKQGFETTILPVDHYGMVSVEAVRDAITDNTTLITIMHANNEVGTIMPIAEIGRLTRARGIVFHVDAVQSFGKIPVDVNELNCDLLTISAHKIYGPKGIGALYIRKGTRWKQTLMHGGAQEQLRRAGTENIPGIIGLGKAAELATAGRESESNRLKMLRDRLINGITGGIGEVQLTGHPELRLPNHASFCFEQVEAESLLYNLDLKGIAASSGSACTSGSMEPSHVLLAMGMPPHLAYGSLRLTLGRDNTEEDIEYFLATIGPVIEELRSSW